MKEKINLCRNFEGNVSRETDKNKGIDFLAEYKSRLPVQTFMRQVNRRIKENNQLRSRNSQIYSTAFVIKQKMWTHKF